MKSNYLGFFRSGTITLQKPGLNQSRQSAPRCLDLAQNTVKLDSSKASRSHESHSSCRHRMSGSSQSTDARIPELLSPRPPHFNNISEKDTCIEPGPEARSIPGGAVARDRVHGCAAVIATRQGLRDSARLWTQLQEEAILQNECPIRSRALAKWGVQGQCAYTRT